jgi:flavin reductase (DIM6/NTAB) family NADH-FMN oxidoreductase RutF
MLAVAVHNKTAKVQPMTPNKTKRSLGVLPLLYPLPAFLVATYDADGKPNVMTAAWGGICSSDPLSLTVSVRPERWTHDAILARKAFTVCIASVNMAVSADYVGIASGRRYDKFPIAGFTPVRAEKVDAPYIAECPVVLECSLSQTVRQGTHTMMIGAILDVKADEDCFDESGNSLDIFKVSPLLYDSGSRCYYGVGQLVGPAFSIGKAFLNKED